MISSVLRGFLNDNTLNGPCCEQMFYCCCKCCCSVECCCKCCWVGAYCGPGDVGHWSTAPQLSCLAVSSDYWGGCRPLIGRETANIGLWLAAESGLPSQPVQVNRTVLRRIILGRCSETKSWLIGTNTNGCSCFWRRHQDLRRHKKWSPPPHQDDRSTT